MDTATQLSLITEDELSRLERKVREGLKSFVEVGNALLKIQQNRGYALRGYKTFETYCEKEFGFTDRHGRRLITAAQTARDVQKAIGQSPANESVARQLQGIADDPIVLQKVKDRLEKKKTDITKAPAEVVAEAVAAVTGKPKPEAKPAPRANGNGHKPQPVAASGTVSITESDFAALKVNFKTMGVFIALCSNGKVDVRMQQQADEAWNESKEIMLRLAGDASSVKTKTCGNCGEPLQSGVSVCMTCGEVAA